MFLKKLVLRNFKWVYITTFNYLSTKSNLSAYFVIQFSNICEALVLVYLWFLASPSSSTVTYLLVGRIFNASVYSFYHVDLGEDIAFGRITGKLMYPLDFLKIQIFSAVGERLAKNPATIIGFIITAIIGNCIFVNLSFSSITNILLAVLLIPIGFLIQFLLNFLVGCLTFFVADKRDMWAYFRSYEKFNSILSGLYIPLSNTIFPVFISFSPFAFLLHQPMQIYLGKYDTNQTILVFLGGVAWCLFLYILAKIVFKLGLKRNESVGL
jgi:ABC-type uncharacterized transport system permease subunit